MLTNLNRMAVLPVLLQYYNAIVLLLPVTNYVLDILYVISTFAYLLLLAFQIREEYCFVPYFQKVRLVRKAVIATN
jgi:hypothetical protein